MLSTSYADNDAINIFYEQHLLFVIAIKCVRKGIEHEIKIMSCVYQKTLIGVKVYMYVQIQ